MSYYNNSKDLNGSEKFESCLLRNYLMSVLVQVHFGCLHLVFVFPGEFKFAIFLRNFSSKKTGAREPQVEEPVSRSGILQIEFNEVVEPKGLSPRDLAILVKTYGSYVKVAKAIGASEAFVRQNSQR